MRPAPDGKVDCALLTSDYPPNDGGVARLCLAIAEGLAQRGLGCTVIAPALRNGHRTAGAPSPDIRLSRYRVAMEWQSYRAVRRWGRPIPVICGLWYPDGLTALLAGARPLVILAHGSELMPTRARWRRWIWCQLLRRVCEAADLVVTNSAYTRQLVLHAVPRARAVAVPLGVDHLRFAPGDRCLARRQFTVSEELVISSVSRLHAYKGHDVVLRALASISEPRRRRFVYMIAGTGPNLETLRTQASELNLAEQVRFLGFVPEQDLPDVYRASDLFVLCTREVPRDQEVEGFGLVFLEAQACGTPVVGTRTGGIPDAVREGEGGWLIEQDDVSALAGILTRMAEDPEPFRSAGLAARKRVERECTWDCYVDRLITVLKAEGIRVA